MANIASFDAALQLLFAFGGLLQAIAGFLIFLSSYLALFFLVALCIGAAEMIYRAAAWIAARAPKPVLARIPSTVPLKLGSKIGHA